MISTMKKLTLAAVKSDVDKIAEELVWMSSVEVIPGTDARGEDQSLVLSDVSDEISACERQMLLLSDAIETLSRYGGAKKHGAAMTRKDLRALEDDLPSALDTAEEVRKTTRRLSELSAECSRIDTEAAGLAPWEKFDLPLSLEGTEKTVLVKGTLPADVSLPALAEEVSDACGGAAVVGEVFRDKSYLYIYAVCHASLRDALLTALSHGGFSRLSFPDCGKDETCGAMLSRLKKEKEARGAEMTALDARLRDAAANRGALERAYDCLSASLEKLRVKNELFCTESTCILRGWIPAEAERRLADKLAPYACCYELCDPEEGEDVPVKLSNTRFASPFESIIAMYSYPKYKTFDPTVIMGFFYALIFGMIMQDVGYGLLLAVGCPVLCRIMRPKESTRKMLGAFTICGISTMLFGVLFGGYFSDFPHQIAVNLFGMPADTLSDVALWFNPIENNMLFLVLTLGVGAAHMVIGMLIKMYMLFRDGEVFAAIFDVGSWLVLFAGIGLLFVLPQVGTWTALAGAAMLILTQGRSSKSIVGKFFKGIYSLYNIISYLSDLLSYSRIFALGLSGAIIGQVMNILGTLWGGGFVGILVLTLIFIVGHVLNLALSLISAFVHTARLQYIEFFGKFYVDGGRPFRPAAVSTKFTEMKQEAKQS